MPVIGTAGHVDHGKSTLVQALTGIDPDRLREEKERGLTIDLGFAWLALPSGLEAGIVDVPGHERFIKNMLAGAGGIDLALLVVAADEGPRPQTAEHLAILDLLEVPAGIVVITKCDLVEPEYADLVEAELEDTLKGSRLAGAPVIRVSAATGAGLEALKTAIDAALAAAPPRRDLGRGRLPIDRAFTIQGFGAVVTGTLVDGALDVGQEVELQPGGLRGRIRGLQRHRTKVQRLEPGTRAAVNLSGIRAEEIQRGMVLAPPGTIPVARVLDVKLAAARSLVHPVAHDAVVTVLCATAETQARVRLLDAEELVNGGSAWAQLVLDPPIAASPGDHVVVRTPNDTVAGGRVVAVNPRRHRRNDPEVLDSLDRALAGSPASRLLDLLLARPLALQSAAAALGLDEASASGARDDLLRDGTVVLRGALLVATAWLESRSRQVAGAAAEFLAANPLRNAAPREHVRGACRLDAQEFDIVAAEAQAAGLIEARGAGLVPAGYEVRLPDALHRQAAQFLEAVRAGRFSPPTEALPPPQLLAFLAERGDVVDTGAGVVFDATVFEEMVAAVREHIGRTGSISLAETRDLFGTSRKYAQAFLEHLDARHITRRAGDTRTLRS